jgi:hypothetical protein
MQYIRALLLNKQYASANAALQKINILPNEGATDGRQLYHEIELMLALQEMQKKNYKKALSYVNAAKQWPESLGVGKPYDNDIDERLDDWLAYQNYLKLNDQQAAQQSLNKIILYTNSLKENARPSPNNLVSAWAMQKSGKAEEGEKLLKDAIAKAPKNTLGNWALNEYQKKHFDLNDEEINNENHRVLRKFIELFSEQ